jgi:glyoxylase-like metal-dependent hydrolase (beta-lactamase superfamily II)
LCAVNQQIERESWMVQVEVSADSVIPTDEKYKSNKVTDNIFYLRLALVNVVFVGFEPGHWVLIDCGIKGSAESIIAAAEERFGRGVEPRAIILTHGHFDHVGALKSLLNKWDCYVYAHKDEVPFLIGKESYMPPDPCVGGGLMATLAGFYPADPVNVSHRLKPLPEDMSVPEMPGWRWIHTPGHTPGHVSLWRQSDKTLIAGDAFITTAQESAFAVALQKPELHGPPMYFTPDWVSAEKSVKKLSELEPETVISGHGRALHGKVMTIGLKFLANNFKEVAVPEKYQRNRDKHL